MALKKWIFGHPDRETAKYIAEECDADPFVALIACNRGIDNSAEFEFLLSDEPLLCDPNELVDINKAAEIINKAINENKKIAIFGDYDCDGVVSTAILYKYLLSRGVDAITYIPDRIKEGYGMSISAVDKLKQEGVELIITVDNGISCIDEVIYAEKMGMDVVITDHHIPPEKLPDAAAIVDPHRRDCPSEFKQVCGAEVAFKLICVIDDKEPEQLLSKYCDLLAIAVIGDVMPLINENRSIVKMGINKIRKSPCVGISAIISSAGIERESVDSSKISFGIVPRINAAGRMGDASRALKLLCSNDMLSALALANVLDDENVRRQTIERQITAEACDIIEKNGYEYNRVIVVCGDDWHLGVVGIAASKIAEKYGKPTIVLSSKGDIAHGSGRSISDFNLYNAIDACKGYLIKYGGHALAAGLSISTENVDGFRNAINEYAVKFNFSPAQIKIDFCINPSGMSVDMAFAIKTLEPFGTGNPVPIFGITKARLDNIIPISSGKHLRLVFSKNDCAFQAILFGVTEEQLCFSVGDILDVAVTLDANYYRDRYNLSVFVKALRMSGIDEEKFFDQKEKFDDFMSGFEGNENELLPSREQIGIIYKYIHHEPVNLERLKYVFAENLGYAKCYMSLKILSELFLIETSNGTCKVLRSSKTDLMKSNTYRLLHERVNDDDRS